MTLLQYREHLLKYSYTGISPPGSNVLSGSRLFTLHLYQAALFSLVPLSPLTINVSNPLTVWGEYWRSTKTFATFLIIFLKHILMAAPGDRILGWESFYAAFCRLSSSHNLFPQPLSYLFRFSVYHIFTFLTVYAWYQRELAIYFRDLNYRLKLKGCKEECRYGVEYREQPVHLRCCSPHWVQFLLPAPERHRKNNCLPLAVRTWAGDGCTVLANQFCKLCFRSCLWHRVSCFENWIEYLVALVIVFCQLGKQLCVKRKDKG